MKKYFYSLKDEKHGPFSLEEMRSQNITKDTLIWYEGLGDWTAAGDIQIFLEILEVSPPPIIENEYENKKITEEAECPYCKSVLELDEEEQKSGVFTCPNCNKVVTAIPIKSRMFKNILSYSGRIRRTEYALSLISYIAIVVLVSSMTIDVYFKQIVLFPLFWFILTQGAKRCHDLGNSGWFQLIPFYGLLMLFADSVSGNNMYGSNPKGKN